jgi:hypothetical protein
VATVEHLSYSPDLVPVDFYLFPPMKVALKRQRFCNNNEIIKNAMERLKSFHIMASRKVSNTLTGTDRSTQLRKETILKEINVLFCISQK